MAENAYRIVYEGGEGEITEKKSRFIATVRPIETEEEAIEFIAKMKKKYWDARHNCYAYVAGKNQELQRCSDDGEPNGTAGRPMLDVLLREEIHDAVVVVTRYFGGTLLGTGGLVRAYQKATQEGLANSVVIEKQQGELLKVQASYQEVGKLQYVLGQNGIPIIDSVYAQDVELHGVVPKEQTAKIEKELLEATNGKARIIWEEAVEYALVDKELKLF
ncbi:MAG: YigZ family protein [Lachnospiraceae bacterium]|nr:YigZ family protein [Lachnospiraceae bacterium]MDY4616474.1 YigZ family protein [Lachnospiraceae bacterium]